MSKRLLPSVYKIVLLFLFVCSSLFAIAAPPRVHHIYISGSTPGPNPAYAGTAAMKRSSVLRVYYTYADPDGNPESGTTFQWYRYDDNLGTNKTAIPGATGVTYTLNAAEEGKHISVEVRPRDNTGTFGTIREFRPWNAANPNPVYTFNANCNTPSGIGVPTPGNLVIPVSPGVCSPRTIQWQVEYTGINYRVGLDPRILIIWGDNGATTDVLVPSLVNPLVTQLDTFNIVNMSNQKWRVSPTHVFDYAGASLPSTTPNERCTYTMQTTWGFGATSCQAVAVQTQKLTVWDNEANTNLGQLDMNRDPSSPTGVEVGEVTNVCQGDGRVVRLLDTSDFNCTPGGTAIEIPNPNNQARWVQFVYGTANTVSAPGGGAGNFIIINGVSYTAAQLPIYGPVQYLPANITAPTAVSQNIQMPSVSGVAGQNFVVTLRTWNTCAPFDRNILDGNGLNPPQGAPFNVFNIYGPPGTPAPLLGGPPFFANANPATRIYTISIISKPNPPVAPNRDVCASESRQLSVNPTVGGLTYRWYLTQADALANTNVQVTSANFTPTTGQAPIGQRRYFYVTGSGANGCVSDPTEVTLTRRPDPAQPGAITGPNNLCPSSTYVYGVPGTPPTIPITDAVNGNFNLSTEFIWSVPAGWTITTGQGTESITVTTPAAVGGGTVSVLNRYVTTTSNGTRCDGPPRTLNVNVRARPTVNITPDPAALCEGTAVQLNGNPILPPAAGGFTPSVSAHTWGGNTGILDASNIQQPTIQASTAPGVYNLSYVVSADFGGGVTCSSTADNSVVNISASPVTATTGADQNLCFAVGPLVSNPMGGSNPAPGAGLWTKISGPGTVIFNPAPNNSNATATVSLNGIYVFRWTVTNGSCSSFAEIQVDYGTDPGVQNAGTDNTFCGLTGTLNATAPAVGNIVWTQVSGPSATVFTPNNIRNPAVTVTAFGVYVYRMTVTSGTCAPRFDEVQITYNQPATANSGAGFTTCVNSAVLAPIPISGTIGGGASPATGGRWERVTGTGTMQSSGAAVGSVVNSLTVADNYVPSLADFTAGSVQVRLVAIDPDGGGPCGNVNGATITITLDRTPTNVNPDSDGNLANNRTCSSSFVLGASTPTNGTGTWTAAPGITFSNINSPTATVNNLPLTGGLPTVTTLTWTVRSALNVCAPIVTTIDITRNPLPVAADPLPVLCDLGAGSVTGVSLLTYHDAITGIAGSVDRTIQWFSNPARTVPVPAPNNVTVTNGLKFYNIVTVPSTTCTSNGEITFTVRPLPAKVNQVVQICEDAPPGSLVASGINLQNFEVAIAGGSMVNRDVEWYEDIALTTLIPPGGAAGAEQNYNINADKTIHAKIIDTASPTTPRCFSQATLTLDYQARPNNNQITDGIGQVLGATYTVCASSNLVLLQINPGLNPGSTYTWTVPPVSYPGEFELLTGTSGFFIILRFPNPIPGGGTLYPTGVPISVKETLGTALCDGNTINTRIVVEGSPPKPIIAGPSSVCSNQNGVVFSVTNPVAGTYAWSLPAGATITSLPVTASTITVQMSTFSGNVTVTHASGTGCTSPAADPFPVTVVNRPTITSAPTATLCSGQNVSAVHTISSNIVGTTYNWEVINVTGSVIGAILGDLANGVLSINQTLFNTSGVTASVTYRITPIGPGPDNCPGTPQNFTVTVNPEPVIVAGQTKTVCSGSPVAKEILLAPANLPAGTLFNWPDPDGGGPATGGVNIPMGVAGTIHINDVLTNLTNAPLVVNYVITPTSGAACVGAPVNIAITVNPQPVGANDNTPVVCSGLAAGYDLEANIAALGNNLIAGNTYSWVATANGSVSGESTSAQSGKIITDVLRNFTNGNQVVRYTVTPTSGAGCLGAPFIVDITVQPEPVGFNDASPVACSDGPINYDLSANIANIGLGGNNLTLGTTYSWVAAANPNVTGESTVPQAGPIINDVINNITNNSQTVVYTVTATSINLCVGTPFTVSITVRPEPKGFNDASPIICSDANVNYNLEANLLNTGLGGNGLISGTTYAWTATANPNVGGENNGTGSVINNVLNNVTNSDQVVVYTVVATSSNGCAGDPFTVSVTVRPEPQGFNDPSPLICSDDAVGYVLSSNIANIGAGGNNLTAGTTYTWSAASNASVSGESTSSQSTGTITDVLNNITNTNQVVVYTVIPTSTNGCVGNSFTVSVTVQPEPKGHDDATPLVCSDVALAYDLSANVANIGLGGNNLITGTTYSWIAANSATVGGESTVAQGGPVINDVLNNVTNSNQVVVYTVTPTSAAGCVGNPFTVSVTVRPEPRGYDDNSPVICSDASVNYNLVNNVANVGLGGNNLVIGTTYSWIAANNVNVTGESLVAKAGNVINDVINNVTTADEVVVYTVTPTSADGCVGNPFIVSVTVRPEPRGFDDPSTFICSDSAVGYSLLANISNTGAGGNNLIAGTTYSWIAASNANVGGESTVAVTGATITDVLNNVTGSDQVVVYTVTPTSINGCVGNPFIVSVTVRPEPRGYNDNTPVICSDATVNYDLSANIANVGLGGNNLTLGTTYSWIAASNPNVTGESTAAQNGSIINDVLNNVTNANQTVVYTVTPTSGNSCLGDIFTVSVLVRPEPRGFNDNSPIVCSDGPVNYNLVTNISNIGLGGNNLVTGTTFQWLAADNPNVTGESFSSAGTSSTITDVINNITNADEVVVYTVTPISSDGCVGNPFTVSVTVRPEPKGFNDPTPLACSDVAFNYDLAANIANVGSGGNNLVVGTTYSWIAAPNAFVTGEGSGTSSVITDVINNVTTSNQTVVYTVTATSGNGCVGNPFTISVTVRPEPRGFNDNTPVICSDANVNYNLAANIANTVSGGNNLVAGTTYSWVATANANVGGESTTPQPGAIINDVLNNITNINQVVVYTVTPTSALGCDGNPFIVSITVRPEPRGFDDTKTICSDANVNYDLTTNIANTSSGGNNLLIGTTYSWIAADNPNVSGETTVTPGISIIITDVLNNITNTDQVVVYTVTATSNNGCAGDPFTVSVTVRPEPRGFNDNSTVICSDGTVGYSLLSNISNTASGGNNLVAGTTYSWVAAANPNVSGESTVAVASGTITDILNNITNADQIVVYTVVATSSQGCVGDPFTVSVTVRPEPKGFNDNSPIVCSGANVNYDLATNISNIGSGGNNLVAGTTYSWVAADNPSVTGETLVAANTSVINDILINVTGSNQIVVYTITPTSTNSCVGDPFTVSVTVRPQPIGLADTDAVCSDEQINYNIQTRNINLLGNSVASQFTYTVISSDPGNVSVAGKNRPVASSAPITDTYTNTTSANVLITYTITPFSTTGNCQGAPFDVVVTIHPEPLGPNTVAQRCSDVPVNFDLQNVINTVGTGNSVPSKFKYSVTSNNPLAVPPGPNRNVASTAIINDVYTNITNADVEITYTVTPVSLADDCEGSVFTFKVTVHPEPVGANVVDPVCSTALNYNIQTQNINTLGNAVPSVFTYTVSSSDPINVPPAPDRVVATNLPITDSYTNSTGVDVTVTYTITPFSSANNCEGTPFTYAVTISSKPVGADVTKLDVCSDVAFAFNPQADITNGVIATFTWTATYQPGLTVGGLPPPASGTGSINGTLTNTGNAVLNATYTVIPTAGTCVGDPFVITVPIQPEPVVATNLNAIVCSGVPYNTLLNTNSVSIGASNYDIAAVVDPALTGVATTGLGLPDNALVADAFQNVTSIPLKVIYTVTPHGTNGCVGDPKVVELTVNPEPVVNPALDNTVCSREVSGIILSTNGTSVAANSYRLVGVVVPGTITADPLNTTPGTTGNINLIRNDKFTNTTAGPVVVIYEIVGISPAACEGQSEFINLTINPEPIMTPGAANLCSDVLSGIIVGPAGGSTLTTQFELKNIVKAPALVAGGSNAGLGTYPANLAGGQSDFLSNDTFTNTTNGPLLVTYTIVPIAGGCRGQDQTVVFTVNAAPAVDDNLNKTVCSDGTAGIVFATETSPPSVAAASYNVVTIVVQGGLVRTAGNPAFPRNGVTANDIQADQFRNPTNDPLTVTYGVQAVSGAPCLGPIRNIVLTVEPEIIAAPVNNAPVICSTALTNIDLISPTNPTSGVVTFNYTAVSSVGGLISGFVPALNNLPENYKIADALVNNSDNPATVTYSVTAVANGAQNGAGCSSLPPAVDVVVTVEPKPKLIATPSVQTICEGIATAVALNSNTTPSAGNVQFELLSANATGGVTGMSAVGTLFNPGSTLADVLNNPTITSQTVTYTFQPRIIGGLGCAGDNVVVTITVNPLPTIVASAQPDICSGDFVNITLTPDVANTVATWTVSAPVTIVGESNGAGNLIFQTLFNNGTIPETVTYTVTPRVNGCNGTPILINVVVNPKPVIVGLPNMTTVCHGGTLNIPLNSTVAGTTFDWVVDDPSGLGVPPVGSGNVINQPLTNTTGSQASLTYTITPTGPGACPGDQKIMIVTVSPEMDAFFVNPSSSICKGSSEFLIIQLNGQAPFQLVYNDGTSNITVNNAGNFKVIQVTPAVTTTYTLVSATDAFSCPFTPVGQSVTVTVGETDANFSIVGPASSCGPYNATFQFNQVAGTQYTWQWFDGSPDDVFLAATTIPNNTISHTFTNPNPNAAITYKVTLRTELPAPFPGCFKTQTNNVTVFPSIITNAFPDRSDICSGENVQFFNQSFGATSHRWFYRVQGTATEIDVRTTPTVNYNLVNTSTTNPIIYEVVYQANNGNCPAADVVMPITVYRAITAGFNEGTIPPFIGGNSTVTFTNTSVPVDVTQFRYEWNFGLNATPATGNGAGPFSVNYSTPGPRDISLRVVNIAAETALLGCESSFTKTINIPLLPLVAAFKADPLRGCFPSNITVTENTSTGDVMDWRVVDSNGRIAATSNAALPVFKITNPGNYSIFLTTSNSLTGQVANTQQDNFEVFDIPLASFDLRPTTVFVPDTELTTFNFSTGATDYDWDFGDGGKSVEVEPVYVYKVEGAYDVRLIARNDHGQGLVCTDTLIRKVTAKQGGVTKVPNAFTPNPNGPSGGDPTGGSGTFNDVFLPIVKGADEFNMQIFDRWGNLIFESNSSSVGWDGYDANGRLMPAGVYVYKLTIRLSDGQRSTQIGDVSMIR